MLKKSRFSIWILLLYASTTMAQESYDYVANPKFASKEGVEVPNHLKRAFLIDAARISMRTQEDWSHQSVKLPKSQVDLYYNLLLTIYQQDGLARKIANCEVHTTASLSVDYLEMIYDKEAAWAKSFKTGVYTTSNSILNKLMEEHDLIIESHKEVDHQKSSLIIRSVEPINMAALANKLYEIDEVKKINLSAKKTKTTDIEVQPSTDGWQVIYLVKFKEGKTIQQHSWIYKVYESGSVEFVTEAGAPIPDAMNCY